MRTSIQETGFATSFNEETKEFMTKQIPKKLFGLGVGSAFIGAAEFGFGAGLASYSIYHRYTFFRKLMYDKGYDVDWDDDYYSSYYEK